jgi:hypothetical protein
MIAKSQKLKEHELHHHIKENLETCKDLEGASDAHVIEGQRYQLKVMGHVVCPQAFAKLWGSSLSTLQRISKEISDPASHPHDSVHRTKADYLPEESLKDKFLLFLKELSYLHGYDDHRKHVVLTYNSKEEVYEVAIKSEGFGLEHMEHSTFMQYWSHFAPNYHIRVGRERCARCVHYEDNTNLHPENAQDNAAKRAAHKDQAHHQAVISEARGEEARTHRDTVLSFCCDNAAKLHLPRRAVAVQKESSKTHIDLVMSNVVDDSCNKSHYYVHHDAWSETSNTIITSIYRTLQMVRIPTQKKLYLHFDNHSTNKCNTVLAFLQYLVLMDWFDEIYVLFFIAWEAKNRADRGHAKMHVAINGQDIFSPLEFVDRLHQHGIWAEWMTDIRDWERFFSQFRSKISRYRATARVSHQERRRSQQTPIHR